MLSVFCLVLLLVVVLFFRTRGRHVVISFANYVKKKLPRLIFLGDAFYCINSFLCLKVMSP